MFAHRPIFFSLCCSILLPLAACHDRPTIVAAHSSQRVADVRPELGEPEFDAAPQDPKGEPVAPVGEPDRASLPVPVPAPVPDLDPVPLPDPVLSPAPIPLPDPVGPTVPKLPQLPHPRLPELPPTGPGIVVDPVAPGIPWPAPASEPDNLEPPLPIDRCFGEAMTCERINVLQTWFNDCADQAGCSLTMACGAKDTLGCAEMGDAATCAAQGCVWHIPEPAPRVGTPPKAGWLDWRRYVDVVDRRLVDPVAEAELGLGRGPGRPKVAVGEVPDDTTQPPAYCVAPERPAVDALCTSLTTEETCGAHAAMCNWYPVTCAGEALACDAVQEAEQCALQVGCAWGVD
jgi:hypothetical protein